MPNTVDAVQSLYNVFQSGVVVSGNTQITLAEQFTSGSAIMSLRVSGFNEYIQVFRMPGAQVTAVTGGTYQGAVSEVVAEEIYIRRATYDNQQVLSILNQRIADSKITVASGAFNSSGFNLPRPYLSRENAPMVYELNGKARLEWRFRYLL